MTTDEIARLNPKQWLTTVRSASRPGDVKLNFPLVFKFETCTDGAPSVRFNAMHKVYRLEAFGWDGLWWEVSSRLTSLLTSV